MKNIVNSNFFSLLLGRGGVGLLFLFLFASCSEDSTLDIKGMFSPQGETVNTRFAQSMEYNAIVGEIHLDMHTDDYTIYVCSDSHITRYGTYRNLEYFIRQYDAATSPKLALHLGDLIDAQNNYPCADSILRLCGANINPSTLTAPPSPLFITPGNHDIYFKQWPIYRDLFRTSAYWFDTNNGAKKLDLFICLDSAEGELGDKQTKWLENLLKEKSQEDYRHIIVFTHTHLWKLDASQGHTSNYALEATYELTSLLSRYGVECVWSGHQHARQLVNYKGVEYRVLNATKDEEKGQSYMIANMSSIISYQFIEYPKE